ncbi:hypothetical protein COCVIDRAFT_30985 [Bipolaris victoriae FI3]|uniref:Uncharacterized protein n=1 Tax=Bipolaris victoriae (strain FI3) TaxID=930091 RepID=W7E401_BIPV3|nr:hypothetical protein COCVIDRAFT_30985 [Bipolaris victoriae FI3]
MRDPRYKPLLMSCSCKELVKKLQAMYPGVVSDTKTIGQMYNAERRECLPNFCELAIPRVDCVHAAGMLRATIESLGIGYTDVTNEDMKGCVPTLILTLNVRPMICILRLSGAFYAESVCEAIRALLEHNAQARLDQDIEFSIDDTICGN